MNVYERIFKLWTSICKMMVDGVRDPERVAEMLEVVSKTLQAMVNEPAVAVNKYLRRLFTFTLGATDGKDNYETAREVFKAGFDPDFENWGIVFSGIAPETEIAGDELISNGKFSDFLENTAAELEKRRILGSQFLKICRDTPDKLQRNGCANFSVLTKGDKPVAKDLSNVFGADVRVRDGGGLSSGLRRFQNDYVWFGGGGLRIFSPQL